MTWDPEALTEQCNHAMSESNSRNPLEFPWGLFSWGDAPPAIGGGVGAFQWFPQLDELLAFVTDLSPAAFATFDVEEEWLELQTSLRQIAEGFDANAEVAIQAFNAELTSLLQIDWIGNLEGLMAGNEEFPAMVRSRFRGDWDDTPSQASLRPIQPEEQESFLAFLSEYGN
jgi:hypothetical protein